MRDAFVEYAMGSAVTLRVMATDKFKTTAVKVLLRRPLRGDEVTYNALLPRVLRRGTRSHPDTRDVARHLEELYGADLSAAVDKIGETHVLEFSLEVANDRFLPGQPHLLVDALDFLAEVLFEPALAGAVLRSDYVEQEAAALRRRLEGLINDKPQYAANRLREAMFPDEPFGLHRWGRIEDLAAISPSRLWQHYRRVLAESPVDMYVVGAVAPDEVARAVAGRLVFPDGARRAPVPVVVRPPGEERSVTEEQEVQQAILTLGLRTAVRYPDPAYPALLVYNGILGGYAHSKLFANVRERAGLAYFVASHLEASKGMVLILAGIDPARAEEALALVRLQLAEMRRGNISGEELGQTRRRLANGFRQVSDDAGRLIDHHVLGLINGRVRGLQELIGEVQQVSVDDVVQVAQGVALDTVYLLRNPAAGQPAAGEG